MPPFGFGCVFGPSAWLESRWPTDLVTSTEDSLARWDFSISSCCNDTWNLAADALVGLEQYFQQ